MATALDHEIPSFRAYVERQGHNRLNDDEGLPRYAHPMDEWIIRSLKALPVRMVLEKAIDTIISAQYGQQLAAALPIDHRSFPDLFAILTRCADTLGIALPHAVAQGSVYLYNAYTAGTDDYAFIVITDGLCERFTGDEAAFVVGHECGHIATRHVMYNTLAGVLADISSGYLGKLGLMLRYTAGIPLLAWSRRSEITADRAGLLCCGDILVAETALLRLIAGRAEASRIDIDDYIRRYKEMSEYHSLSAWQQMFSSHPLIPKRIEALRLFARSELYHDLSGTPVPLDTTLLSREELDRRVSQIVKP
jgi:Zn-dependent protease with chaperone function